MKQGKIKKCKECGTEFQVLHLQHAKKYCDGTLCRRARWTKSRHKRKARRPVRPVPVDRVEQAREPHTPRWWEQVDEFQMEWEEREYRPSIRFRSDLPPASADLQIRVAEYLAKGGTIKKLKPAGADGLSSIEEI